MKITTQQAEVISRALFPGANYLIRLRRRMEQTHFAPTDELFQAVCQAQDAVQRLCVLMHYASCTSGVGRRPDESGSDRSA